jgi:hypothetical protein
VLISPVLKLLHSIENTGTDNRGRRKTKSGEMQVELSNLSKGTSKGGLFKLNLLIIPMHGNVSNH